MSVAETFAEFFAPLTDSLDDVVMMQSLLADLGVEVELVEAHKTVFEQILPVLQTLTDLEDAAGGDTGPLTSEGILDLAVTVTDAIAQLATVDTSSISSLPGVLTSRATWERIAIELPGYLLLTWLEDFYPVVGALIEIGGAIDLVPRGAGQPPRRVLNWTNLGALITNPPEQIAATWSFGGNNFDADGFLRAFANLIHAIGPRPRLKTVSAQITDALGNRAAPAATSALEVHSLGGRIGTVDATAIVDLVGVSQAGSGSGPAGLAFIPTISGSVNEPIELTDDIVLTIAASGSASGGVGFGLYPGGLEAFGGGGGTASLSLGFEGEKDGGWIIIGEEDASHLRIERFAASARVGLNPNDISVSIDLADAIALKVTGGEDGLLSVILGNTEVEVFGGVTADWSKSGGWQFSGGAGLEVQIPIGEKLGPFEIASITLAGSAGTEGFSTSAAVTGSFELGPIQFGFDEIGVIIDLTPKPDGETGTFGPLDVLPAFKPPSGYGASLDFDPISGGGHIQKLDAEYRGALALQFEKFGISAFAILNTELPGGQPGFSFAASVFATFNVPLAAGFFLTGVGGVLGINRTVDTDAMREVLYDGRLDDLLFPADPIAQAPRILEDMATILPPQAGQHFIGPVARISWGQPQLIHVTLGVIIEVGEEVRLVILGGVKMALPTEDQALVVFNLQFFGEIDFTAGTIDFDATLEGSRVLTFTINGDVAVRSGWGPGINQIASLGGLHPQYPKPSNLPDLRRLSAGFGKPADKISLTISGYFAQALTSVQFGAWATLKAEGPKFPILGRVSAEGTLGFDALIYFNPFSFLVSVDGGLSLMVNGKVKAALYFAISMAGPNPFKVSGEVWVKVCKINVRFSVTRTFGNKQSTPDVTASAVDALREALEGVTALEAGASAPGAVSFRSGEGTDGLVDPMGQLRLTQSAVPLDLKIEKLGEADLRGPDKLELSVFGVNGSAAATAPLMGEFVRGHFFDLKKAERLREPAIETHEAGVEFTASGVSSNGEVITDDYAYEIIEIGAKEDEPSKGSELTPSVKELGPSVRQFDTGHMTLLTDAAADVKIVDQVKTSQTAFVVQSVATEALKPGGDAVKPGKLPTAISAIPAAVVQKQDAVNATVVDYLSAA